MYVPGHFAEESPDFVEGFIEGHPFAQLVTLTNTGLFATGLPMIFDREAGVVLGHVARANRQWQLSQLDTEALVIFSGVDGYISPSWSPSKAEHGKVVPTWNYEAVHVRGRLVVHEDGPWLRAIVERLTDRFESAMPEPWRVDDAPDEHIASMLQAIVGIEVQITSIQAKRKLSQNKPPTDIAGMIDGLRAQHCTDLAEVMHQGSAL